MKWYERGEKENDEEWKARKENGKKMMKLPKEFERKILKLWLNAPFQELFSLSLFFFIPHNSFFPSFEWVHCSRKSSFITCEKERRIEKEGGRINKVFSHSISEWFNNCLYRFPRSNVETDNHSLIIISFDIYIDSEERKSSLINSGHGGSMATAVISGPLGSRNSRTPPLAPSYSPSYHSHSSNPDQVALMRQQISKLKMIVSKLTYAFNGLDVDWNVDSTRKLFNILLSLRSPESQD